MIPSNKIQSLQAFRGFAALAVLFYHCAQRGDIHSPFLQLPLMGYLGVDFFFVLSGFIIMYAHMRDPRTFTAVKTYLFKRITRIYPAYWPVGLAVFFLAASAGFAHYSLIGSIFLIPTNKGVALPQAWTLVHEVIFYGVFLLFFVSGRALALGLLLWAIGIFSSNFLPIESTWMQVFTSPINLEFMLGVMTAWIFHYHSAQLHHFKCLIVVAGFFISVVFLLLLMKYGVTATTLQVIFAAGLALIILGAALYEKASLLRWPAPILLLGNASYSIYLIHFSVIALVFKLMMAHTHTSFPVQAAVSLVLSLLLGLAYYFIVERPALRLFRRKKAID